MVHGADQVARAERAASVLFGGSLADATVDDILMVFDDAPSISIAACVARDAASARRSWRCSAGLAASKGEAGRLIKQGGLYVNDRRLTDERGQVTMADAIGAIGHRAAQRAARAAHREDRRAERRGLDRPGAVPYD